MLHFQEEPHAPNIGGLYFSCMQQSCVVLLGVATGIDKPFLALIGIFVALSFIPIVALRVRRLHDIGKSGWWIFLGFVPYIGEIILFIFSVMGSDGENEYGPDPFDEN